MHIIGKPNENRRESTDNNRQKQWNPHEIQCKLTSRTVPRRSPWECATLLRRALVLRMRWFLRLSAHLKNTLSRFVAFLVELSIAYCALTCRREIKETLEMIRGSIWNTRKMWDDADHGKNNGSHRQSNETYRKSASNYRKSQRNSH